MLQTTEGRGAPGIPSFVQLRESDKICCVRTQLNSGWQAVLLLVLLIAVAGAAGTWLMRRRATVSPVGPPEPHPVATDMKQPESGTEPTVSVDPADAEPQTPVHVASEPAPPERQPTRRRSSPRSKRFTTHTELLAWIEATGMIASVPDKMQAFVELGKEIGAEDFDNALLLAGGVSDAATRNWLYRGIFNVYAAANPVEALRAAEALYKSGTGTSNRTRQMERRRDYDVALIVVISQWAAVDPAAALAYAKETPPRLRGRAQIAAYGAWAENDATAALGSIANLDAKMQKSFIPAVFKGWARRDPEGAARYALSLEDSALLPKIHQGIAAGFLAEWGTQDPTSAVEWAVRAFPPEVQQHVLPQLYSRWAKSNPERAAYHALLLNEELFAGKMSVIGTILRQWSESDVDAALAWADQTLTSDHDYVAAISAVTHSLRYEDPLRAAKLLERIPFSYADDTAGASEMVRLMAVWSRKDPRAAAAWAIAVDNRALKTVAIKTLAANWTSRDYGQALNWAASLSDPDMRAYALSNVALRHARHGMRKSDDWIRSLPPGFVRARTAAGFVLGSMWRAKDGASAQLVKQQLSNDAIDPAELRRIVSNSGLDSGTKDHLIGLLD